MRRERFTPFDFGLSWLAGFFHQDWTHAGSVEDVFLEAVGTGRTAATVEHDADLLIGSTLSNEQIELLWLAMTERHCYWFTPPETGRDLLHRFRTVSRDWQQQHGTSCLESDPEWETPELRGRVLRAIKTAPLPAKLQEVLAVCAGTVSAELAFRLLLRVYLTGSIPVAPAIWTEYQEINTAFALGEYVIEAIEFLVEDPD
ncbi:hypothetical protein OG898_35115 [Streptomyces sp. NBC_00193]|uniref:hypothetical protein n=1 Tax=Streptomyces sp. NBC_00193 TaxID=2975675 RepID=UPI00225154A0|nr:hypothetical protein [Streptomyces sp. NBC_00193]MCX5301640.1 hypothetical protein [Streptomyces sp. NBC_00193]